MGCHWNVMTLDVIFWHLFWSKKTSKFYGNVMTFWWNSTGFLWGKGIPVKCHENVMKFQCHSMGLKMLVHFDGIFMEKVHGIVMEFDVIFDQNSDGNQWWHFIMRDVPYYKARGGYITSELLACAEFGNYSVFTVVWRSEVGRKIRGKVIHLDWDMEYERKASWVVW